MDECATFDTAYSGLIQQPERPNRARLLALTALAKETVEWLEKKGLKRGEECQFRQLCETMFYAEGDKK